MSIATLETPQVLQGWARQDHTGSDHRPDGLALPSDGWGTWRQRQDMRTTGGLTFPRDLIEMPTQMCSDVMRTAATGTHLLVAKTTTGDQFERAGLHFWCLVLCSAALAQSVPDDTTVPRTTPREDVLQAADELRAWLGVTYDDLQAITGIAKNTFHYWRRTGARPRPSTVRRLWRAHALVQALITRLGQDRALVWLRGGPRAPLDTLIAGDLEIAESAAHSLLFRHPAGRPEARDDDPPFHPEPEFEVQSDATAAPVRRASRRPRRGRLTES